MTDADDLRELEIKAKLEQDAEIEARRKEYALRKTAVAVVKAVCPKVTLPKEITDVKELAKIAMPYAVQALLDIAYDEDSPPAARVSAATVLLDRGFGKAAASMEISGKLTLLQLVQESMKIDKENAITIEVEEEVVI